jgi:hypothetical protein
MVYSAEETNPKILEAGSPNTGAVFGRIGVNEQLCADVRVNDEHFGPLH